MNRNPRAIHQRKQRSRFLRDLYLLVIVRLADFAIARQQRLVQLARALNRLHKQRRRDAMQLRIRRVQQDQPMLGEQAA